jgi:2-hydroxycyclohexanecarboxyl-CoA dehydrogenase
MSADARDGLQTQRREIRRAAMNKRRVVVVTGAASEIGVGISRRFAEDGYPVAMLDLQGDALKRESAALAASGAVVLATNVDVSNREQLDAAYAVARRRLGPVSVVIANASISTSSAFVSMSVAEWQRMLAVNLTGVFHTIQAALPDMVKQKWGRIVTIASQSAPKGVPDRAHYAAASGGVISLTKALARELAPYGITANTIPLSRMNTPPTSRVEAAGGISPSEVIVQHIPNTRLGTREDIASACEFLCSDKAKHITGEQINVNGGGYV